MGLCLSLQSIYYPDRFHHVSSLFTFQPAHATSFPISSALSPVVFALQLVLYLDGATRKACEQTFRDDIVCHVAKQTLDGPVETDQFPPIDMAD